MITAYELPQWRPCARSLIRNSFLKSLRTFMPSTAEERIFVLSLMPDTLYHLYEETLNEQSE